MPVYLYSVYNYEPSVVTSIYLGNRNGIYPGGASLTAAGVVSGRLVLTGWWKSVAHALSLPPLPPPSPGCTGHLSHTHITSPPPSFPLVFLPPLFLPRTFVRSCGVPQVPRGILQRSLARILPPPHTHTSSLVAGHLGILQRRQGRGGCLLRRDHAGAGPGRYMYLYARVGARVCACVRARM